MKKNIFALIYFIISSIIFSSCSFFTWIEEHNFDINEEPREWPESDHTYLIYMIGDNSLYGWCKSNTQNAIKGLLKSETLVNLVIYDDSWESQFEGIQKGTPVLYRLKRNFENKEKVDTIMIHKFETDHNSADPEIMQSIINEAFAACPASVKGLEIWCHGLGWAPSANYTPKAGTRATQWVGPDDERYIEIWQLRQTLEKCPHFNYLAFDACNMAQAEVAYELRGVADYMMACPTEIMAAGLPYTDMIQILSGVNNASALTQCLPQINHAFELQAMGSGGGTFSILDLKAMTDLHHAYKSLLAACPERLQLLKNQAYVYEDYMQQFGRASMGSAYLFYDMITVADFLSNNQTDLAEYVRLKEALSKAVLYEYHSSTFLDFGKITSCGLGVGVPEVFSTIGFNRDRLTAAYNELQWTKD